MHLLPHYMALIWTKQTKEIEKTNEKSIFKSVKSPVSGKKNVQFADSPDFENFLHFCTGRDVQ